MKTLTIHLSLLLNVQEKQLSQVEGRTGAAG
jgi:hypothetical protein